MAVTREDVLHIAELARLGVDAARADEDHYLKLDGGDGNDWVVAAIVTIASTPMCTSSAARRGYRSDLPSAKRHSMITFCPSM